MDNTKYPQIIVIAESKKSKLRAGRSVAEQDCHQYNPTALQPPSHWLRDLIITKEKVPLAFSSWPCTAQTTRQMHVLVTLETEGVGVSNASGGRKAVHWRPARNRCPQANSVAAPAYFLPTATVCLMSRTAKRPSGGYSVKASTHIGLDGIILTDLMTPTATVSDRLRSP